VLVGRPLGRPFRLGRDLEPRGIFSRGRFGCWKYEIGNQDLSLRQGVELVDRWMDGTDEGVPNPRHRSSGEKNSPWDRGDFWGLSPAF
jgi:hypothetical protein